MPQDDPHEPVDPKHAREQAADLGGFLAGWTFDLGGGESWELPNQLFWPPDMSKRHRNHLRFMKTLDKDTPLVNPITGVESERYKFPYELNGEDIDIDELLCIALMGEDVEEDRKRYLADGAVPQRYQRFLDNGGVPGQIQVALNAMSRQVNDRARADSKSR